MMEASDDTAAAARICPDRGLTVAATLNDVRRAACGAAAAGPVGVEEFTARFGDAFVGVRADVVALGLEQVGWKHGAAVAVVKRERGAERRHGDTALGRGRDDVAPALLAALDFAAEII